MWESTAGSAVACSGDMYAVVPSAMKSVVIVPPFPSDKARAMPKSVIRACRPLSMTLSGLMSRCTTPRSCEGLRMDAAQAKWSRP